MWCVLEYVSASTVLLHTHTCNVKHITTLTIPHSTLVCSVHGLWIHYTYAPVDLDWSVGCVGGADMVWVWWGRVMWSRRG